MTQTPLISIIMPVRNGLPWFIEAVGSIARQTFTNWELLIIDDGSTDGTDKLGRSLENDRIRFLHSPGFGLVDALNFGLRMARGQYLARMDADDIAHPQRLEKQCLAIEAAPNIGVVYTSAYLIDESGKVIGSSPISSAKPADLGAILTYRRRGRSIVHPTVLMRAAVLRAIGGYRNFVCAEDRDLWLRLLEATSFVALNEPLLYYRLTDSGVSRSKAQRQEASALLAVACHNVRVTTGVDLYLDRPDIMTLLDGEAIRMAAENECRLAAFVEIKRALRGGQLLRAIAKALALATRDPTLLWSSGRLALHKQAARCLSDAGERLIPYERASIVSSEQCDVGAMLTEPSPHL